MRKTGLIILMTAAALSMSACGRTEKPESTKPSGTVANEKETVKKTEKEPRKQLKRRQKRRLRIKQKKRQKQKRHYLRVNQRQQQLMKTFCS